MNTAPIGIFDSGVGGLSVLGAIKQLLPDEDIVYIADQDHVPYGTRSKDQVRNYAVGITRFLLGEGVKLIVVACNTASAAALFHLRSAFPQTPFVGMEPAVKPAAEGTQSGVVGVLATPATFQGELYTSVVERFANGVDIVQDTCPGLVTQIENGELDSSETRKILENGLHPMIEKGIDRVVMGCTHYSFVIPLIQEMVGPQVEVIDPAPAVARQTRLVLQSCGLSKSGAVPGEIQLMTTGNSEQLEHLLKKLMGLVERVQVVEWVDGKLQKRKSGYKGE
jgi:glutamate racemase